MHKLLYMQKSCIMNNPQKFSTKMLKNLLVKLKTLHFSLVIFLIKKVIVEKFTFLTFSTCFSTV